MRYLRIGFAVLVGAVACGDDTTGTGGAGGHGGSANAGGTGGAGPVCAPQFASNPVDCPEGCTPVGPTGAIYCTTPCTASEDCVGTQECAQSATEPSMCFPPCEAGCDPSAYCDTTQYYPGYCIPIGYNQP